MSVALNAIGIPEFARNIIVIQHAFFGAYVVANHEIQDNLSDLAAELDGEIIYQLGGNNVAAWLAAVSNDRAKLILATCDKFATSDWLQLDARRSSFVGCAGLAVVLCQTDFEALMQHAPNLASWLGACVFSKIDEAAAQKEIRERRLAVIREHTGLDDEDILRDATSARTLYEPIHAEWLTLLGRSDLLK
jgi:proteasome assembly chaperone (PAC2) family protein